jgi:hypothetical protein
MTAPKGESDCPYASERQTAMQQSRELRLKLEATQAQLVELLDALDAEMAKFEVRKQGRCR